MFRTYLTMKIKDWSSTKSQTSGFGNIYVIGKINKARGNKCKRKNGKCEWGYSFHRHWFSTQQTCYRSYLLDLLRSTQTRNTIWIIPLVEFRHLENSSSLKPPKYAPNPPVCTEAEWKIKVDVSRYTADLIHISMVLGVKPLADWGLSVCTHVFMNQR